MPQEDLSNFTNKVFENSRSLLAQVFRKRPQECCDTLESPEFQNFLNENEKFDVAIMSNTFNECFLSVVYKLNVSIQNIKKTNY